MVSPDIIIAIAAVIGVVLGLTVVMLFGFGMWPRVLHILILPGLSLQVWGNVEHSPGWELAAISIFSSFKPLEMAGYVFSIKDRTLTHSILRHFLLLIPCRLSTGMLKKH